MREARVASERRLAEAQRHFLVKHHGDLMQGYHLGRPMPAPDVLHLLAQSPSFCLNTPSA